MALRLRTVVGLTVPNLGGRRQQSLPDSTLCSEVGVVMAGGTHPLTQSRSASWSEVEHDSVASSASAVCGDFALWPPPTDVPPLPVRQALRAARPTKRKHHD